MKPIRCCVHKGPVGEDPYFTIRVNVGAKEQASHVCCHCAGYIYSTVTQEILGGTPPETFDLEAVSGGGILDPNTLKPVVKN